jgi:hypothetical protein
MGFLGFRIFCTACYRGLHIRKYPPSGCVSISETQIGRIQLAQNTMTAFFFANLTLPHLCLHLSGPRALSVSSFFYGIQSDRANFLFTKSESESREGVGVGPSYAYTILSS